MAIETKLLHVNIVVKANVYFGGKVVSHTIEFPDGTKKTVGVIFPGSFTFDTAAAERMDIIAGVCKVHLPGRDDYEPCLPGGSFEVPAQSSFDVIVDNGIVEYLCTYK